MEVAEAVAGNEKGSAPVGPILISVSEADVSGANQTGKVPLSACSTYIAADRWIQDGKLLADKTIVTLNATVSTPRISRYATIAGSDKRLALRLHTWNAAVAASILPTLHIAEVAIRNFALQRIRAFYKTPKWYESPALIRKLGGANSQMALTLDRAYQDEVKAGKSGDLSNYITSELPFGFWVNVFTSRFANELWSRPLHTYSTSFPRGATLQTIHDGVDDVRAFRNNVAHHKNIICKPVEENFQRTLEVLSWFCKQSSEFARQSSSFPAVWACCPVDPSLLKPAPKEKPAASN
ncbi:MULTISPECIES: hypothetical protein [Rhizobium]|uniref:hypothetical protein n=1 Tax=Rhizobium TaxID=379 RepID=UPI0007EB9E73|nr:MULTISPECIES: hypothetical protein [Rhizobium]ANK92741.1 abortive infection system AbiD/AbiF-like protein [Rhizobium sp. N6212]ANK98786.1 abortive infection system AbiD/AbiF-like protein [Rhizobium sp. N621]ANL04914.1 abortive infection system AbiD/AbiF-like protein [Rhizobium esperanzae]ANL10973.1 abortive infection system AbiD/AbiF-like protein [Rhizobium sp. N1341]ANL23025.1 abortive infection system AbiD/AbiF-like protein [Rhizobium sp. N113]